MNVRNRDNHLKDMSTTYIINKMKNVVDMLQLFEEDKDLSKCIEYFDMVTKCHNILLKRKEQKNFLD